MSWTNISQSNVTQSTVAVSSPAANGSVRIRGFIVASGAAGGQVKISDVSATGNTLLVIPMASSLTEFFALPDAGIRSGSNVVYVSVPVSTSFTLLYDGG